MKFDKPRMMKKVFIGLGTNLGDKASHIEEAISFITERIGSLLAASSIYQSPPWGFESKTDFYNSVILIKTQFSPEQLLQQLKLIESQMGRIQREKGQGYQDRIIDLDIIDYDGQIIRLEHIVIPHERMHERDFVLYPLQEIAPDWYHPFTKKTAFDYIKDIKKQSKIVRLT